MITDIADVSGIEFGETRGRQAMTVIFGNGESVGPTRMTDIDVVPAMGDSYAIYDAADPILIKSGWNWNLFHNDGSHGVHNPSFATNTVETSAVEIVEAGIAHADRLSVRNQYIGQEPPPPVVDRSGLLQLRPVLSGTDGSGCRNSDVFRGQGAV